MLAVVEQVVENEKFGRLLRFLDLEADDSEGTQRRRV